MGDRHAEDGHDRVSDELLDRASVVLDRPAGVGEVAVQDAAQHLGVECLGQLGRLDQVAEEDGDRLAPLLRHHRRSLRRRQRRILAQNRLLELAQQRARLEPELLIQRTPRFSVDLERVCLAAGAVESEHELAARALVEWALGDRRLQLEDELGVPSQLELGVDEVGADGGLVALRGVRTRPR